MSNSTEIERFMNKMFITHAYPYLLKLEEIYTKQINHPEWNRNTNNTDIFSSELFISFQYEKTVIGKRAYRHIWIWSYLYQTHINVNLAYHHDSDDASKAMFLITNNKLVSESDINRLKLNGFLEWSDQEWLIWELNHG